MIIDPRMMTACIEAASKHTVPGMFDPPEVIGKNARAIYEQVARSCDEIKIDPPSPYDSAFAIPFYREGVEEPPKGGEDNAPAS